MAGISLERRYLAKFLNSPSVFFGSFLLGDAKEMNIKPVYIYLTNESALDLDVFFDELTISHVESPIIQEDHYYPFGLIGKQGSNPWTFQGQEKQDELNLGWIQFKWRNHDPAIGRFFNVDPLADSYVHNSPYAFSENKVVAHVELEGLESTPFMNAKIVSDNNHKRKRIKEHGTPEEKAKFRRDELIGAGGAAVMMGGSVLIGLALEAGGLGALLDGLATTLLGSDLTTDPTPEEPKPDTMEEEGLQEEIQSDDSTPTKKVNPKKQAREAAKEKRDQQPASEDYAKYKAKEQEKKKGKDARRRAHDKKKGSDRSKDQLDEDFDPDNN